MHASRIWWFQIFVGCITNCVINTIKKTDVDIIKKASIHTYAFCCSRTLDHGLDTDFMGKVIQYILNAIKYNLKIIRPFNKGSLKRER